MELIIEPNHGVSSSGLCEYQNTCTDYDLGGTCDYQNKCTDYACSEY